MTTAINDPSTASQPAQITGMGSIIHNEGVFFRVWAQHAQKVFVAGEFNSWSESANEMAHEENGYWGIDISSAKAGDQYKYILHTDKGMMYKNDPYAKEISGSFGNS